MDKELRNLLVETARGILKVLDAPEVEVPPVRNKRVQGMVARMNEELSSLIALPDSIPVSAPAASFEPQRVESDKAVVVQRGGE